VSAAVTTFVVGSTNTVDRVELHAEQRVDGFEPPLGDSHMTDKPTIPTDTKKEI